MRTLHRLGFAAVMFLLATGFTECEYFKQVTVPASDVEKPLAFNAVYLHGEYVAIRVGDTSLTYQGEPGDPLIIVAGGTDNGGVKKVTIHSSSSSSCCSSSGICSQSQSLSVPTVATQDGTVGGTVSNGVFAAVPATVGGCPAGSTSGRWGYGWYVTVEDFHGNITVGPSSSVYWRLN